jgi:hypothetical protein
VLRIPVLAGMRDFQPGDSLRRLACLTRYCSTVLVQGVADQTRGASQDRLHKVSAVVET